jgi:purine nucleosidase
MMEKQKVLLDTDIGSDIDDAVCLAYLLAQPECDLLGITTVTGESPRRAEMASAMCKVAGRDVPIFPGAEKPFLIAQQQPRAQQATTLGKWPHRSYTKSSAIEAVSFLRDTIRRFPGQVHLLTIGPLSNAGLLFAIDPEIPSLLKGLTLMCGIFNQPEKREWNAIGDPHATAIVYNACPPVHRSIGLDVTMQVQMDARQVRQKFQAELLRPVLDFAEVWFQQVEGITFHDPLAATTLFDPEICNFTRGKVQVDLSSRESAGTTRFTPGEEGGYHEVALQVDPGRFFDHYFSIVA